jgi:branched-chain amino acid transport system substrate-binding protein
MSMVDVLRRAGGNLTRASVIKAARTQNQAKHPLVVPGIVIKTSATDGFPIEQVALQRWVTGKGKAAGHWSMFGPLRTATG